MEKDSIKINTRLCKQDVHNLLEIMDSQFSPKLSDGLDLEAYSIKLSQYALFVTYKENKGLIAYYLNEDTKKAYIPLVWVDVSERGKSIATTMINGLQKDLKQFGFKSIDLEVLKGNTAALTTYKKMGFKITEDRGLKFLMSCKL